MEDKAGQGKLTHVEMIGTRNFPKYNICEHMSFVSLTSFLESMDKKRKTEKITEMRIGISKS